MSSFLHLLHYELGPLEGWNVVWISISIKHPSVSPQTVVLVEVLQTGKANPYPEVIWEQITGPSRMEGTQFSKFTPKWLQFYFLKKYLSGFGIGNAGLMNELGHVPSSIFGKTLCRIRIIYSLNVWQNSAMKPPGPEDFFIGRFLTIFKCSFPKSYRTLQALFIFLKYTYLLKGIGWFHLS